MIQVQARLRGDIELNAAKAISLAKILDCEISLECDGFWICIRPGDSYYNVMDRYKKAVSEIEHKNALCNRIVLDDNQL